MQVIFSSLLAPQSSATGCLEFITPDPWFCVSGSHRVCPDPDQLQQHHIVNLLNVNSLNLIFCIFLILLADHLRPRLTYQSKKPHPQNQLKLIDNLQKYPYYFRIKLSSGAALNLPECIVLLRFFVIRTIGGDSIIGVSNSDNPGEEGNMHIF